MNSDKLKAIAYEKKGNILVGGTREGKVLFWKNSAVGSKSPNDGELWKCLPYINLEKEVHRLSIGKNNGIIGAHYGNDVAIISETVVKGKEKF